ncbi:glycosyl transferase family protein [Billgrantia aerodenitrificans]|uniref:Phage adsorption protein NrfB n=1 Tax=Billgrantia aerodenitrificans TaxID=2733483 RepID=A0ABS9AT27_9GAMM|nr:glycosyl transferase family protein [Halomonas aerodenitrificans]MCE8025010.1 phage adsorption protein NrfB [Halomonas aerodenitrificans]
MTYWLIDSLAYLLYGLKWLAIFLALIMLILGLDDLFIDIVYWMRRLKRRLGVYRHEPRANEARLYEAKEQPLAVMIPAWQEQGVIGEMARLAAHHLDYENYQIFVGTYPNDPDTQQEVDMVCLQFGNVHKVVCARPGPTSKADCLNNVIDAILRFEQTAGITFAGFVLHDAEDVISPLELRLFNYLLPAKDLIQVPVFPFVPRARNFNGSHYIDEFAEYHGKDVTVREALAGQVPSAGVGTCFSRRAILTLLEEGDGIAFDTWSLTEDYDIGFRLKQKGLGGILAHYSVSDPQLSPFRERRWGTSKFTSNLICVREHFPKRMKAIVRQKSRWITGIVFQGTRSLGWRGGPATLYFLWRDRRGLIAYPIGLLVNLLFLVLLTLWVSAWLLPDAWRFPPILVGDLLFWLLVINGVLLLNRLLQRCFFVTTYYGILQGLLSMPRMMWSNLINFLANLRAFRIYFAAGKERRLAWDKTTHEFPVLSDARREPIGSLLVAKGFIDRQTLNEVLTSPRQRRLGRELLRRGHITSAQLAEALAEQAGQPWQVLDPFALQREVIALLPAKLALRYAILPIALEKGALVLASEDPLSPVVLGAIRRQIRRDVGYRIVPQGRVTVGLRYWYLHQEMPQALCSSTADPAREGEENALMETYCRHQLLLGELIQERGHLPAQVLNQALIDFDPESGSLGRHLLQKGLISEATLDEAIAAQKKEQAAAMDVLRQQGEQ